MRNLYAVNHNINCNASEVGDAKVSSVTITDRDKVILLLLLG